jgi:hypothetical protein
MAQAIDQPCLAMGEVAACKRVESIEKGAADAPGEAVIHAALPLPDVLAARQGHGSPLSDISNGGLMESAKKKNQLNGCPGFLAAVARG